MDKIVKQSTLGKYTVLYLEPNPERLLLKYKKYRIDGIEFEPVPVMDSPNTVAIAGNKNDLTGKYVEYI